jgi:hypothetical protein
VAAEELLVLDQPGGILLDDREMVEAMHPLIKRDKFKFKSNLTHKRNKIQVL